MRRLTVQAIGAGRRSRLTALPGCADVEMKGTDAPKRFEVKKVRGLA